jgi:hypothetical protein
MHWPVLAIFKCATKVKPNSFLEQAVTLLGILSSNSSVAADLKGSR